MANLIVYYSRKGENYWNGSIKNLAKGNTERVAEFIQKAVGGDLFEVDTVKPYAADYYKCIDEARLMAMSGRGYFLVESVREQTASPLVRLEVRRDDGRPIVRTYCAFWPKARTNYYIEEFANILREKFAE